MDFDSPDVMKDFPGLYAADLKKKNDNDYKEEIEKSTKKDMLIGKRKDKKDKKDKEKGYAALEGESSDEASACKSKKSKTFKFTKSKDKEKKEKDVKKGEKKLEKDKRKKDKSYKPKHSLEETLNIADALPIFGVSLELAVKRSKCHDGVDIPLPIRECIDYVESMGLSFEGVYKISGAKTKVSHIRKMYNHRHAVNLSIYDIPTATSLLKMFLRDLPEPIFTNELIIRFEEAGAILNLNTREKHLKNLVDSLPPLNKLLLSWLIIHLHNVTLKEHLNKMNKQSIAAALNHTFHISSRLLQALLHHSNALFPNFVIYKYVPPLCSGAQLPENPNLMEVELTKQESLLNQIHQEMNIGCISKQREELLWEVQRIITQLKRKLKKVVQKSKEEQAKPEEPLEKNKDVVEGTEIVRASEEKNEENHPVKKFQFPDLAHMDPNETKYLEPIETTHNSSNQIDSDCLGKIPQDTPEMNDPGTSKQEEYEEEEDESWDSEDTSTDSDILEDYLYFDERLITLRVKNSLLRDLAEKLTSDINKQKEQIAQLQIKLEKNGSGEKKKYPKLPETFDQIKDLLAKENQMLQIKKMNLIRQIIEQREVCVDLTARLKWAAKETKEQKFLQCKQVIKQSG